MTQHCWNVFGAMLGILFATNLLWVFFSWRHTDPLHKAVYGYLDRFHGCMAELGHVTPHAMAEFMVVYVDRFARYDAYELMPYVNEWFRKRGK